MQAAGGDVGAAAELAARVQLGGHHLDAGQPGLGLLVGGDAAPVVVDLDRAVRVQRHLDAVRDAGQRLVDAVVDDLPQAVHEAAGVEEVAELTQPDAIHWCDGSAEEYDGCAQELVDAGTFERLSDAKRPELVPGACSDPGDVARVEDRTFICSERDEDAGPTNNWQDPADMREMLQHEVQRRDARAARCTSCRSRWARSARRSPRSASS